MRPDNNNRQNISNDTRLFTQLFKNDPAKMKMLQDNFPEDWQIELAHKLRNQGSNSYTEPNPMLPMSPEIKKKLYDLQNIQNKNMDGWLMTNNQQNLNAVTGILKNEQENFIGYPSNTYTSNYEIERQDLDNLRSFLNNGILESQEIIPAAPGERSYGGFKQSPYFTMEGALMPAPQMSELEKLMQLSRQQARR